MWYEIVHTLQRKCFIYTFKLYAIQLHLIKRVNYYSKLQLCRYTNVPFIVTLAYISISYCWSIYMEPWTMKQNVALYAFSLVCFCDNWARKPIAKIVLEWTWLCRGTNYFQLQHAGYTLSVYKFQTFSIQRSKIWKLLATTIEWKT